MRPLTERQLQVVRLSALMTDKEIARTLNISPETVDKHMRAACAKLGVSDRKAALRRVALDAPYASGGIPGRAELDQFRDVATTSVEDDDDQISDDPPTRAGPYGRLGLPRTPPADRSVLWLILRRTGMWMLVIAAGVAVMQMVLGFFDRLA